MGMLYAVSGFFYAFFVGSDLCLVVEFSADSTSLHTLRVFMFEVEISLL